MTPKTLLITDNSIYTQVICKHTLNVRMHFKHYEVFGKIIILFLYDNDIRNKLFVPTNAHDIFITIYDFRWP